MQGFFGPRITTSLEKYKGEQDSRHDVDLVWPGIYGFPVSADSYRTDPPNSVSLIYFFHSKLFDLTEEEDQKYYLWVQDRIVNGWFVSLRNEYKWENNKICVFLEWVQRYAKFNYASTAEGREEKTT